ncbi:MAG: HAMP domain-containing histidine kinase [Alphaproteobacteria bacterium]|nr:HAMP domain-containing histidine kinase [Alphaproteobacteria bacterium]
MTDIILETVRALVLASLTVFLIIKGRTRLHPFSKGWGVIVVGFALLLFGSLLDITDNFEGLNQYVVIGDTAVEAFLEKFVGYLGGYILVTIGLFMWVPAVDRMATEIARGKAAEHDVTHLKELGRLKSEFVSTVSHELRTPLTSIKGALGLVRSGITGQLPDRLKAMLEIAYANSDRLIRLINDILDIEKIEAGKMQFTMATENLSDIVRKSISANQTYAEDRDVEFVLDNFPAEAMVVVDKDRLSQVMANLLSNAAKFSPRGGRVGISIEPHEGSFRVSVKDQGAGIPEDFKPRIFEKFSQADSSDTRTVSGTGLGLSICKAILEHHRGDIGFSSDSGLGSTFFFDVPILEMSPGLDRRVQ